MTPREAWYREQAETHGRWAAEEMRDPDSFSPKMAYRVARLAAHFAGMALLVADPHGVYLPDEWLEEAGPYEGQRTYEDAPKGGDRVRMRRSAEQQFDE